MKSLNNNRGVAMLMAIFAMILSIVIATEVMYETQIEYVTASSSVDRLKAYYAAKSGAELSLFRILLYKKALVQFGDMLKDNKSILDPIWQLPFTWPPMGLEQLNAVDKDNIKELVKQSNMDAQFVATMTGEGGKIDINDLGSTSKALANAVKNQLLQIFDRELENNKAFKEKYDNFKFDELVADIQDWVDEDTQGAYSGRDENSRYEKIDDTKDYNLPPNAPFKTLEELHMVYGMEDEFFELLKDKITVYGTKGINVNQAERDVIQSLFPGAEKEAIDKIVQRRSDLKLGGPFKSNEDFFAFVESLGIRTEQIEKDKVPLLYDAEYNFRIISVGQYKNVRRQITAITYDIEGLSKKYAEILTQVELEQKGNTGQTPPTTPPNTPPNPNPPSATNPPNPPADDKIIPKGRPTVVFWQES